MGILAVLVLAGCGPKNFGGDAHSATAGVLREALSTSLTTLDPAIVQDPDTNAVLGDVYEGLVTYDATNQIAGLLAKSWTATEGGKVWTFKLRPEAKFHNGRSVTADDVKWSFERACNPKLNSPNAPNYLCDIVGANDMMAGKAAAISGIRVLDPLTVEFTLDKPRAYFLKKLNSTCACIIPKEAGLDRINDVKQVIGTGPFLITRYVPEDRVELDANKNYYLGAPNLKRIVWPIVKDSSTRLNLYRTGALDTLTVDRQDVPAVQRDPKLAPQLSLEARPQIFYIGFNETNVAALKNRRVRRAIAMAIDRERICNVILGGVTPAQGFIAPGVTGYVEGYKGLPYSPEDARKELAAAGFPGGRGLPTLQLTFRTQTPDSQRVCEAVANNLRQNLNVNVQLAEKEWSAYLDARNKRKLESYFLWWGADYLDPQNFLSILLASSSPHNYDSYFNAEFDRQCEIGDTTPDEAVRAKAYATADDIAVQDAARVPIFFQKEAVLVSPRLKNLQTNLFGQMQHVKVSAE